MHRIGSALHACALLAMSWTVPAIAAPIPWFEKAACAFEGVPANWATEHRVECGWLHVPESRDRTDSRMLRLWVAVAKADRVARAGDALLYLHGGPGFATVDYFFPYFPKSTTWTALRRTRDLVFVDQRGTGRSDPRFCKELATTLDALDRRALPAREALERRRAAYADCRVRMREQGFDDGAYNSSATVEDAEDLRRALGARQWNLYGVSYGSLVAMEYMRRHPERLRAVILDSVFPPDSPHGAEQITSSALAYQALQRACNRDTACRARFPDMLGQLRRANRRLAQAPLARAGGGSIDDASLRSALWSMLVSTRLAPWVPLAIERAAAGDGAVIRALDAAFAGPGSFGAFSYGQSQAVNCYEVRAGSTAAAVRAAAQSHPYLVSPDDIPEEADVLCAAWQTQHAPASFHAPVRSAVPTLLYGGEFDPATPYSDAVRASRHLSNSTLVFIAGASHAGMGTDDCTRGIAQAFLAAPERPPATACLAQRPPIVFPRQGLLEMLTEMQD